jgi:hypothetical protein
MIPIDLMSPRERPAPDAARPAHAASRGAAIVEFALVLPILLFLVMAVIDIGHLIETRMILTNVSREGGSIGSRQTPIDVSLTDMLVASGRPVDLGGADGKVVVSRIAAGTSAGSPNPTVEVQYERGGLGVNSGIDPGYVRLGLSPAMYDHLVFNATNSTADISQVTVVETFFKYRPITPLPNMIPGLLTSDGGGLILRSRAVF